MISSSTELKAPERSPLCTFNLNLPKVIYPLGLALLALTLRIAVALGTPTLFTLDSPSYLKIAHDWIDGAPEPDFRLGSLRLPGYPLFLSLLLRLPISGDAALALGQSVAGTLASVAAFALARALGTTPLLALLPGLFVAAAPPYLLLDRAVMSESLYLALLLLFCATAAHWSRQSTSSFLAITTGLLGGSLLLTRLNALPFLLLATAPLFVTLASRSQRNRTSLSRSLCTWIVGAMALAALLLPWIYWIHNRFGAWTLYPSSAKVRLYHAVGYGLIDPALELERLRAAGIPLKTKASPTMELFWGLSQLPNLGEARARELLGQISQLQPHKLFAARVLSAQSFFGFSGSCLVPASWLFPQNEKHLLARSGSRVYLSESARIGGNALSSLLFRANTIYLRLRWLLVPTMFLACFWFIWRRSSSGTLTRVVFVLLTLAYIATALLHIHALASDLRFALLFDWVPPLLWSAALSLPSAQRLTDPSPRAAGSVG